MLKMHEFLRCVNHTSVKIFFNRLVIEGAQVASFGRKRKTDTKALEQHWPTELSGVMEIFYNYTVQQEPPAMCSYSPLEICLV